MPAQTQLTSADASATKHRRRPGRPTLSNEELLDKALDLFLEHGFERTSIDAITASAGMAKRTVYARYGDKETLFRAALERAIEEWILPLEALQAAETEGLEDTLLEIGRILVENIMSPAGQRLLRITNAEAGRMPEIGVFTYQQGTERTIDYLADLLQRRLGADSLSAEDAKEAAIAFLYLVVTGPPTMTAWGLELKADEIESHTRFGVRLFLHGLLSDDTRPNDAAPVEASPIAGRNIDETPDSIDLASLEAENAKLRKLLVQAMLDKSQLEEKLADAEQSADASQQE